MMSTTKFTGDDVATPEALYLRFQDQVGVFATKAGVVLARDALSSEVSASRVARAVKQALGNVPDPRRTHPISTVHEADSVSRFPLLALDAQQLFNQAGDPVPAELHKADPNDTTSHSLSPCFIPAHVMLKKFNIPVGACGVTGQLLPGDKASDPAWMRECAESTVRVGVATGAVKPELLDYIVEIEDMLNDPAALDRPVDAVRLDSPVGYDSDAPVTDAQKAKGITAWRRLENPADADQAIMLPIYDVNTIDYSTDELRAAEAKKVPHAGDDGLPENFLDYDGILYPLAVSMVALRDSPILWGPSGVGKSSAYRHLAYLMQLPFERISITPSTEVDELAGKMEYHPDEGTVFRYGRLANAWTHPSVTCLDEPNSARPDVWFLLRPLLDSEKQFAVDASQGEILPRHESSYLGAAANPSWDYRNSGTNPLADADISRLFHAQVGLPPERVEADIIRSHCKAIGFDIPERQLKVMRGIATDLRDTADGGSLMFSWGTRSQLKVAKLLPFMTMEQAYQAALGASLEPEQEDLFMSTVRGRL